MRGQAIEGYSNNRIAGGTYLIKVHKIQHSSGNHGFLRVHQSVQQSVKALVHVERRSPHCLFSLKERKESITQKKKSEKKRRKPSNGIGITVPIYMREIIPEVLPWEYEYEHDMALQYSTHTPVHQAHRKSHSVTAM